MSGDDVSSNRIRRSENGSSRDWLPGLVNGDRYLDLYKIEVKGCLTTIPGDGIREKKSS